MEDLKSLRARLEDTQETLTQHLVGENVESDVNILSLSIENVLLALDFLRNTLATCTSADQREKLERSIQSLSWWHEGLNAYLQDTKCALIRLQKAEACRYLFLQEVYLRRMIRRDMESNYQWFKTMVQHALTVLLLEEPISDRRSTEMGSGALAALVSAAKPSLKQNFVSRSHRNIPWPPSLWRYTIGGEEKVTIVFVPDSDLSKKKARSKRRVVKMEVNRFAMRYGLMPELAPDNSSEKTLVNEVVNIFKRSSFSAKSSHRESLSAATEKVAPHSRPICEVNPLVWRYSVDGGTIALLYFWDESSRQQRVKADVGRLVQGVGKFITRFGLAREDIGVGDAFEQVLLDEAASVLTMPRQSIQASELQDTRVDLSKRKASIDDELDKIVNMVTRKEGNNGATAYRCWKRFVNVFER
ncbi:hypothetical protein CONPUDRAFT_141467 [Coniophora puteana RWD-64-598 SS2]|uniref:Uncharacterized protein n=1 Tax=Coniophora puteana (strain RWD-64-598) TaxID=741705 RepID=A0A5M3N762_CONPW|nr:uncharacterized protein CONPUDRAFT_141467 [Coniophora puteana RWD-64-598 SS2]EIW87290.1 hypothetical protein CONPUDRAFT_141467 [Coniophora puteana RWD-64-598 SS2]